MRDVSTEKDARIAWSSGCDLTMSVWWKNEMNGWYVVSMIISWSGSPLNAIRWRALRTELIAVRLATGRPTSVPLD